MGWAGLGWAGWVGYLFRKQKVWVGKQRREELTNWALEFGVCER